MDNPGEWFQSQLFLNNWLFSKEISFNDAADTRKVTLSFPLLPLANFVRENWYWPLRGTQVDFTLRLLIERTTSLEEECRTGQTIIPIYKCQAFPLVRDKDVVSHTDWQFASHIFKYADINAIQHISSIDSQSV